ncbi:MAG: histidine--tRNA ligase [Candidatus Buchananbacteria bacterium]|nr:histidine--tRNA ligase [Candidatus Buchananbacteria bacterium]
MPRTTKKTKPKKKTTTAKKTAPKAKPSKEGTTRKAVVKSESQKQPVKISKKTPQLLRGFKDILPGEQKYWDLIREKGEIFAYDYGFERIDLPFVEETSLFIRSVGKETDIIDKEMFSFEDRGGESVSLRPEATASVVRAYINHGMLNLSQPVKLYYIGPMFRYDRPQSGRYRQFNQLGFEILGDIHPVLDAQIIILSYNFFKELGVPVNIQINSIGCPECRKEYKVQLINYYKTQKADLCEDCQGRLTKNPLRLLDCKHEKCKTISEDAPQIVDWLCDECKNHFVKVLEFLDEIEIPYNLDPTLVRGLDYYTKTVFEILPALQDSENNNKKAQNSLGGGGRYDNLIELLGGRPTPAVGASIGVERAILKIKELEVEVQEKESPDIFIAQLGEAAKRKSLAFYEELRDEGIKIVESFSKDGLKSQLDIANKLGVKYTLILGQKELAEETILLRDMEGGVQETINYNKAIKEIKKRLGL